MKQLRVILSLSIAIILLLTSGCDDPFPTTRGIWVKSITFRGVPRSGVVTFSIGNQVFAGLGYNGRDYLSDFYLFEDGIWKSVAKFPGPLREKAIAFSINSKGYIGLGSYKNTGGSIVYLNDFWEYDSFNNQWKQLKDFSGGKRDGAVAVAYGQKGYVGTGFDGTNWFNDFWAYTPNTDTWQQLDSYPSAGRVGSSAFVMNGKILLVGGKNNSLYFSELWEYDPQSSSMLAWTSRAQDAGSDNYSNFKAAVRRSNAVAFAFRDKAYITLGASPSLTLSTYEYNPTNYRWTVKNNFYGSYRQNAIWFISNNNAYVGMGDAVSTHFDDIWEWRPDGDM